MNPEDDSTITITLPSSDSMSWDNNMYSPVIDTTLANASTITITGGNVGQVYSINGNGASTWGPIPSDSSIKLGEDFEIVAPTDGPAKMVHKGQELEIGQLFGMFNAFKSLLKVVAEDPAFCEKHPEIRDMAYSYLIEEIKR